ncbi:MAG TPA: tRNA (guanosine(37)-N1)-methyltransferase TrmD [Acidimicrobiales bacterium]
MTLRVDVLTLFPEAVTGYATTSVLGRASERGVWELFVHDFRDATTDVHHSVDDTPFGGGAGMVLRAEPILATIESTPELARPIIALTPSGRVFTHDVARELSERSGFTLLCGRYEGFDQRVLDLVVDDEISLGDFVLSGGELAALSVIEAVVRLLPGALGNDHSSVEESFGEGLLEYPQFTKPADVRGSLVPEILLSGDHARIARWRRGEALRRTLARRPDLIERRGGLSDEDRAILAEFPALDD